MNPLRLENWKFIDRDDPDAWLKGYTDSHWNDVIVPHDWSVTKPFSRKNSSGTGYLTGGTGWYRSHFYLNSAQKNKKIFVYFDGIYKNSQIWCNSYFLGERPSGYTSFWYDITDFIRIEEEENVISVRVKHDDISDSRWFTGSGIYRKVQILMVDPVYAVPDEFFFQTVSASQDQACFTITDVIANDTALEKNVDLTYTLVSPSGSKAACCQQSLSIPANSKMPVTVNGTIDRPELFSCGMANLYQVQSEISAGNYYSGSSCHVGIRSFHFDANNGFYLNGSPMKLKGVCVHHDAGVLGAAVWKTVWERRLQKLRNMGCNAIRMSHNPHMPELYDLCDELGFLVIDEAFDEWEGVKNKWSTGHNVYPPKHQGYFQDFPQWHEQDLTALIKRDRNHPCIIMWSIGNEIDYPNDPYCHPLFQSMTGNNDINKPAEEQEYKADKPNAERLTVIAKRLRSITKQYDTTRPVSAALAFPELSTQIGLIEQLDVAGYNYKEQWYKQDHTRFPEMPFLGSENTHTFEAWQAVTENNYISGQFLWTGIDFLGEAEGWPVHGSNAGLLTLAGMEKVDYYRRQSFWAEKPVIHLATRLAGQPGPASMMRKWDYPAKELTEVVCYTNQPAAELFLNGKSLGSKELAGKEAIIWSVPFDAGTLEVRGGNSISDTLVTTSCGSEITLALWESAVQDNSAYRLEQIEVFITDTNGNWVCSDSSMLFVNVSGGGSLQGLENGDTSDNTDYFASYRRAYEGRLLIYVMRKKDETIPCTVTVAGRGLKTGTLILG